MHIWRFLIPILAVIGAVASFSERTLIDVRQQCFERLERNSPISRSENFLSERLFSAASLSDSTLETRERENYRRCHSDPTREFLNHRRSYFVKNRKDRPKTQVRNLDFRISLGDRKISRDYIIERSIGLTSSARRNTRNIKRDVENKYQTTIPQFDSRRNNEERRSADNWATKSDDVVGRSRKTRSLERVLLRSNRKIDAKQERSRSVSELLNSRYNEQERQYPELLDADRLTRTTRIVRSRNNENDINLSSSVFESRLTSGERRALKERKSLRSISIEIFPRNTHTVQRLQTRENGNEEIGLSRIRSTTMKSERLVRIEIISRNGEDKTRLPIGQDFTFIRQNHRTTGRSYSASENLARLTMNSHNAPGFTRDIDDRTRSSLRFFESRPLLVERRFSGKQYTRKTEGSNNNLFQNKRVERVNFQSRTKREINMRRRRSIDVTDKRIVNSFLNIRDEDIRHRSKSLNANEVNIRREQNIRSTRSDRERTNSGRFQSGLQRTRIAGDLNERFNENLRGVRAREEFLNEFREDRISRERLSRRFTNSIERSYINEERQLIARSQENDRLFRFSRNIQSQLRRTETRRLQPNSPLTRETSLSLKNEEPSLDATRSSRLQNKVDSRNRQATARYSLSQSDDSSHLDTRTNARNQSPLSIESQRNGLIRTGQRQALDRMQMRDKRTKSTLNIRPRSLRNSQYPEKNPRRQPFEKTYMKRPIVELSPLQNSGLTIRLSAKSADVRYRKETLKGENHASNRIFAAELIATRALEDIFEKILNHLEWKTVTFYVLQSAYVCAILFHIVGGSGMKENNFKIYDWIPAVRHSIKVD